MGAGCRASRAAAKGGVLLRLLVACASPAGAPEHAWLDERVVLLHGLGRSEHSMTPLAEYLAEQGYRVTNVGYASTRHSIRELVERLHEDLRGCCLDRDRELHFVTHSLGGILVRAYVARHPPQNLGRVVMLSPPNKGSELADAVRDSWLAELHAVPVVEELGTDPSSVPNRLGPASFELGIITGERSWHPLGALLIEGRNDGVVSVESARLEGARAFLVVPSDHTHIMRDPQVAV